LTGSDVDEVEQAQPAVAAPSASSSPEVLLA